ncbi:TolC family protein [Pontibacter beigongshangensis]|uniref:TolC family protein n=1 Tax=Pontibacter beigongshangensis TaxID=2574733 RepID=UPI00164F2A74|nr:TolC family protein [Pontibacter beigongshangensis]
MKLYKYMMPALWGLLLCPTLLLAQQNRGNSHQPLTLDQCIEFALAHQPSVKQAAIDEAIGERDIAASLSGWMPQISAQFAATHNLKRAVFVIDDNVIRTGQNYTSNVLLQANQTLYSNSLLLASRAARYTRLQLDQNTTDNKINTVVDVSKAFYDILLTQEQLRILDENISRQEKQFNDARSRYEVGLVDKTDYQRASISLSNSRSDRKRSSEAIKAKTAYLKQLMGYDTEASLQIASNYEQMELEALLDTTQQLNVAHRIEFQQLQTQKQFLKLNTSFHRWSFIPNISAFINYNPQFFSATLGDLYNQAFPTSAVGLQASIPIFQGTQRLQNLKIAQLQEERLEVDEENVRKIINTEYQTALANYKSEYTDWLTLRENASVAEEVYHIIKLQYDEGVKAYVDLVVAETDLKAAQLNYYNALYRVLASKLDFQRAIGTININQ